MRKKFVQISLFIVLFLFIGSVFILLRGHVDSGMKAKGYYDDITSPGFCNDVDPDTTLIPCEISPWAYGKKKVVVFTWDDCNHGIEDVSAVFNKHNLKTTFFVNTAAMDNIYYRYRLFYKKPLVSVVENALMDGHEVGTHTHNHINLSRTSLDVVNYELQTSSDVICEKFGFRPSTMSHPESCYNLDIDSIMRTIYLSSRYSMDNDKDSLIRYMQVRRSYDYNVYAKNLDSFIESNAITYVYGGHQLDNEGYEPMPSDVLDKLLSYVEDKYGSMCWITTFEDMLFYKHIKENVIVNNINGNLTIDMSNIQNLLEKYSHPHALITLMFPKHNVCCNSRGLVSCKYDGADTYCTIDLRKSNNIIYSVVDRDYKYQQPMRNGLNR